MPRLLLVDDSATLRRLARLAIERSAIFDEIDEAEDGFEAFRLLREKRPDLVLCDLNMPKCSGLRFLQMRGQDLELLSIPVIMLTSDTDNDRKADLLEHGAADYVVKPFHARELLARVRVHLRLKLLQEELREANQRMLELSTTDGLTGLRNRRSFDEAIELEVARAQRYGAPLSMLIADIDHFKRVNDTFGHAAGDEVLRGFAAVFREGIRQTDFAARYGGEEVVVLMPHTDEPGGLLVAERLRASFEARVHTHGDHRLRGTASFGVATLDVTRGPRDAHALLESADAALYSAKQSGRNRVQVFRAAEPAIPSERPTEPAPEPEPARTAA